MTDTTGGATKRWWSSSRIGAAATLSLLLALTAGCSDDSGSATTSSAQSEAAEDVSSVPDAGDEPGSTETPDISEEVGDLHPEGAHVEEPLDEDAPAPPESVEQVLCNLNSEYLTELADLGQSDDGANMPLAALSLSDNIQVWETLVGHYPDTSDDVDRAKQIHNYWREAMAHQEVGDAAAAEELYASAEAEIAELSGPDTEELGC